MILNTAESMYRYFLTEIRKERTIVVSPNEWTSFINTIVLDWVNTKLPQREFNQKRIDDLEAIKVITDDSQYHAIECIRDGQSKEVYNIFAIPYEHPTLPAYLSGLSASFFYKDEIHAIDNSLDGGDDDSMMMMAEPQVTEPTIEKIPTYDLFGGRILRSDKRVVYKNNPYREPDDKEFIYFEQRGGHIYAFPKEKQFNRLVLEYYKYPAQIVFTGNEDKVGSFQPAQNKEICDMAVTRYLERVSDQRIQTQPSVSAMVPK